MSFLFKDLCKLLLAVIAAKCAVKGTWKFLSFESHNSFLEQSSRSDTEFVYTTKKKKSRGWLNLKIQKKKTTFLNLLKCTLVVVSSAVFDLTQRNLQNDHMTRCVFKMCIKKALQLIIGKPNVSLPSLQFGQLSYLLNESKSNIYISLR